MTKEQIREVKNLRLRRFLSAAERSNPFWFNSVLIVLIVAVSTLLFLGFHTATIALMGPAASESLIVLAALAGLVAMCVAPPTVTLGYLLLRRIQSIRDDLRKALQATEIANRAKTDFLANMSHEIRTPLNGVLGMAQILETSDLNPEQREALRIIGESGELLMSIIADVLDLSKIENGQISLAPAPERLAEVLAATVELFRARAAENKTSLKFSAIGNVPDAVIYDSVRVRQCVANLVSNAVKFTNGGAVSVELSASAQDDDWIITLNVKDTGIGIEENTLKRLFQPFEQADVSTSRIYGGTGLGLALSRRFARLMGGDITVRSECGNGSCFTFWFKAGRVASLATTATIREVSSSLKGALSGKSILVVDDSRINRRVVRGLLQPFGPTCIEAEDGVHALQILSEQNVDLILLDMHMPRLDGLATLERLRASSAPSAATPVVALTADVLHGRRDDYIALGFEGFLSKPLMRAELEAELLRIGLVHAAPVTSAKC
ncbi:MAG: response regulator [Rhodobacteraceae bacterium]|nr:MAG: response regulator [Paracoccaceae bacterium]